MHSPVILGACFEARKATISPTSFDGLGSVDVSFICRSFLLEGSWEVGPGATQLTLILYSFSSHASFLTIAVSAPFDAA